MWRASVLGSCSVLLSRGASNSKLFLAIKLKVCQELSYESMQKPLCPACVLILQKCSFWLAIYLFWFKKGSKRNRNGLHTSWGSLFCCLDEKVALRRRLYCSLLDSILLSLPHLHPSSCIISKLPGKLKPSKYSFQRITLVMSFLLVIGLFFLKGHLRSCLCKSEIRERIGL